MLYPNEDEAAQRRSVAAHYLAEPIRRFEAAGGALPYNDLSRIVKDGGARLDDLDQRWRDGTVMGRRGSPMSPPFYRREHSDVL
jgi:hypothetical protein